MSSMKLKYNSSSSLQRNGDTEHKNYCLLILKTKGNTGQKCLFLLNTSVSFKGGIINTKKQKVIPTRIIFHSYLQFHRNKCKDK